MLGRRSSFRPIHGVSLLRPSSSFTVAMLPYATRQHRVQTRLPSRAGHRWPRCVQALDTVEQKQHLRRCSVAEWGFSGAGGQTDSPSQGFEELLMDQRGGGKEV